jgi:Ca-activated chloride channel family protein
VFAFGVGYDVNTYLLDRLASAGRGSTQYVSPEQDVEQVVGALSAKIRHPVLTDLELAHTPVRITEVYPVRLPDLFSGEELVIFGRYAANETARGDIVLTGRRAGRNERYASSVEFPSHDGDNEFIARLWAARKVGVLAQRLMLEGRDPELVRELRETALRYGVLTEHTSYLVLEPEAMVAQDGRRDPRLQTGAMAPPPSAPADFVGQGAVAGAASAQARREVRNSAELDRMNKSAAQESLVTTGASSPAARTVAGRAFRLVNGTWTDTRAKRDVRVVRIEAFSPAYFALLRRLPELEPYWKAFAQVEVAGERVAVRVAPGGVSTLGEQELAQVVGEFRAKMALKR